MLSYNLCSFLLVLTLFFSLVIADRNPVVYVSHKVILHEVLPRIGGQDLIFYTHKTIAGFIGYVEVSIPRMESLMSWSC